MSTTDAHQHLDRIRQARDGQEESSDESDEPAIYICPIDGCSRTVVGNPAHLRSHIRQAGDDAHRYAMLNEDLAVEFDSEAYHADWGPGVSKDEPDEADSIYDPGDPWGPGVPENEVIDHE